MWTTLRTWAERSRRSTAWLAASCLLAHTAGAQELQFDSWTVEHGLPQSSVTDIAQTPDGYLWLATYGGLVRFDGNRFTVVDRSVDGVGSVRTRALHVEEDGTLWAGTDDGALLRLRDGRFTTFTIADGQAGRGMLRIDKSDDGALWITGVNDMTRFDGERFVTFRPGELPENVGPQTHNRRYASRAVWWSLDRNGVHCLLDGRVDLCLPAERVPRQKISWIAIDQYRNLWFHTAGGNVIRKSASRRNTMPADDEGRTSFAILDGNRLSGHKAGAGKSHSAAPAVLLEDRSGGFWLLDPDGRLRRSHNGRVSLAPLPEVLRVFQDRSGSVWIGSAFGLHRLRDPVVSMISSDTGLPWNNVYSLLRDRQGQIWVGTWSGGLIRYSEGRSVTYGKAHGLPATEITALFEDAAGRLLVGTVDGLVYRTGDRLLPYDDPHGWLRGSVWAILEDDDGFWFGTDQGLVRRKGAQFERFTTTDGLPHARVTALLESRSGTLWIGTLRGLAALREGVFTTIGESQGFVGSQVRTLLEDDRGVLWVGTYDAGLYRLEGVHLTRYTTRNGLFDNGVFQILDDGRGSFWMCSNRGISRVARSELDDVATGRASEVRSVGFGTRDGMASAECNGGRQPAGLRMPDGTLWFPTQGGIAVVDPAKSVESPHTPPVIIEELRFAGQPAPLAATVEIPFDRNSLEVRYTAIDFVRPEQTRFRYRLVGLDESWIDARGRREAVYFRLPSGRYRFEVTAASSDGDWDQAGAAIVLVVQGPFWRRAWFLALLILIAVSGTTLAIRRRFARLRREHSRQRAFGRQLLETQEQERRRLSHELHDSLGQDLFMIRSRARSSREETTDEPAREALLTIETLVTESYAGMKRIAHDLRPYQLDKIGLSRTIQGMLARVTATGGMALDFEVADVDACFTPAAAINVFRIVQEAVNNAVRHSGAVGARVSVARRGAAVEIVVSDDGRGFDATVAQPSGLGLMSLRERVHTLGGSMRIETGPGSGTRVTVMLPVQDPDHG